MRISSLLTPELVAESYTYVDMVCMLIVLADYIPQPTPPAEDQSSLRVGDVVVFSARGKRYGVVTAVPADNNAPQDVSIAYLTKSDLYQGQCSWVSASPGILDSTYPETQASLASPSNAESAFRIAYLKQAVARRCRRAPWACRAVRIVSKPIREVYRCARWNEPGRIMLCPQTGRPTVGPDARPDPFRGRTPAALTAQLRSMLPTIPHRNASAALRLILDYQNGALLTQADIVAVLVSYYADGTPYPNFPALHAWLNDYDAGEPRPHGNDDAFAVLKLAAELTNSGSHALWRLINQPDSDIPLILRALKGALTPGLHPTAGTGSRT